MRLITTDTPHAHVREFLDDVCEATDDLKVDVGCRVSVNSEVRLNDDLRDEAAVSGGCSMKGASARRA